MRDRSSRRRALGHQQCPQPRRRTGADGAREFPKAPSPRLRGTGRRRSPKNQGCSLGQTPSVKAHPGSTAVQGETLLPIPKPPSSPSRRVPGLALVPRGGSGDAPAGLAAGRSHQLFPAGPVAGKGRIGAAPAPPRSAPAPSPLSLSYKTCWPCSQVGTSRKDPEPPCPPRAEQERFGVSRSSTEVPGGASPLPARSVPSSVHRLRPCEASC